MLLVLLYLVAIVLANLSVAYFGPPSVIFNAFVFIGLDLTTRDGLHERWQGRMFVVKMGALIAAGSVITVALNWGAMQIAVASFAAFALAAIVDTIVYQVLNMHPKLLKSNGSNVVSAAVDSIAFPTIAFGMFMPEIVLGQFIAKVAGGFLWSLLLQRFLWAKEKVVAHG
jgi:uncharacterized PurR-regulated membrane protein YhhQ (DUF165 family)